MFVAAGNLVAPSVLIAGYGVPLLLGRSSPPKGRIAVVEIGMTALYIGLGILSQVAVVVIRTNRFIAFWLSTIAVASLVISGDRVQQEFPEFGRQLLFKLLHGAGRDRLAQRIEHGLRVKDRLFVILVLTYGDALIEIMKSDVLEAFGAPEVKAELGRKLRGNVLRRIFHQTLTKCLECGTDDRLGVAARGEMRSMLNLSDKFIMRHGSLLFYIAIVFHRGQRPKSHAAVLVCHSILARPAYLGGEGTLDLQTERWCTTLCGFQEPSAAAMSALSIFIPT